MTFLLHFQPVTYEEVEKAAKISPLAMSLVKPPDPEILSGLSVKAQRELMSQHAQKFLSQPGSRSGSQPVSRTTSVGDLRPEADVKGKIIVSYDFLFAALYFGARGDKTFLCGLRQCETKTSLLSYSD